MRRAAMGCEIFKPTPAPVTSFFSAGARFLTLAVIFFSFFSLGATQPRKKRHLKKTERERNSMTATVDHTPVIVTAEDGVDVAFTMAEAKMNETLAGLMQDTSSIDGEPVKITVERPSDDIRASAEFCAHHGGRSPDAEHYMGPDIDTWEREFMQRLPAEQVPRLLETASYLQNTALIYWCFAALQQYAEGKTHNELMDFFGVQDPDRMPDPVSGAEQRKKIEQCRAGAAALLDPKPEEVAPGTSAAAATSNCNGKEPTAAVKQARTSAESVASDNMDLD
jgi:hypothetical protein